MSSTTITDDIAVSREAVVTLRGLAHRVTERIHIQLGEAMTGQLDLIEAHLSDVDADALDAARVAAEQRAGRIFRELMKMRTAHTFEEEQAVFDRAAAVLNGSEPPDSDLDPPGDPEGAER